MDEPMETMLDAVARLRAGGYGRDLEPQPGGRLRCGRCGLVADAGEVAITETVRFEGTSNPDDEEILMGMVPPCGHRGLYRTGYGTSADADDADVLRALSAPRRGRGA